MSSTERLQTEDAGDSGDSSIRSNHNNNNNNGNGNRKYSYKERKRGNSSEHGKDEGAHASLRSSMLSSSHYESTVLQQQQQRIEQLQRMVDQERSRNSMAMAESAPGDASRDGHSDGEEGDRQQQHKREAAVGRPLSSLFIIQDHEFDGSMDSSHVRGESDYVKRYRRLLSSDPVVRGSFGGGDAVPSASSPSIEIKGNGMVTMPKLPIDSIMQDRDEEFLEEMAGDAEGWMDYLERGDIAPGDLGEDEDNMNDDDDEEVGGGGDGGAAVQERKKRIARKKLRRLQQRASHFLHHPHNVYQFNLHLNRALKERASDLEPLADNATHFLNNNNNNNTAAASANANLRPGQVHPFAYARQKIASKVMPLVGFGDSKTMHQMHASDEDEQSSTSTVITSWVWSQWESLIIEPPSQLFMDVAKFEFWNNWSWIIEILCKSWMCMQLVVLLLNWCSSFPFIQNVDYSAEDNVFNVAYTYSAFGHVSASIIYYASVVLWFGAPTSFPQFYHYGIPRSSASITVDPVSQANVVTLGPSLSLSEHNLLPPLFYVGSLVSLLLIGLTMTLCSRSNARTNRGKVNTASESMIQSVLFHGMKSTASQASLAPRERRDARRGLKKLYAKHRQGIQAQKALSSLLLALLINCLPALYIPSITGLLSGILKLLFVDDSVTGVARPDYWIYALFGVALLLALCGLTLLYIASFFEWRPPATPGGNSKNIMARPHSRMIVVVFLLATVLVFCQQIIGFGLLCSQSIQEFVTMSGATFIIKSTFTYMSQDYILSIFHLCIVLPTATLCIYLSPYYRIMINRFLAMVTLNWICTAVLVLFSTIFNRGVSVLSFDASDPTATIQNVAFDPSTQNDLSDIPLLAFLGGLAISICAGLVISFIRINGLLRLAHGRKLRIQRSKTLYFDDVELVGRSEPTDKNKKDTSPERHGHSQRKQSLTHQYRKSTWSPFELDIASRFLVSDIDKLAYCNRVYEVNSPHFAHSSFFHLSWATFTASHVQHPLRALEIISLMDDMYMPLDTRIAARIRYNYWRQNLDQYDSDDAHAMSLDRALFYENEARILQLTLWNVLDQISSARHKRNNQILDITSYLLNSVVASSIVDDICFAQVEANRAFRRIVHRHPSVQIFRLYARFLREVMNDPIDADKKLSYASLLESGEAIEDLAFSQDNECVNSVTEDREHYMRLMAGILEHYDNKTLDVVSAKDEEMNKRDGIVDSEPDTESENTEDVVDLEEIDEKDADEKINTGNAEFFLDVSNSIRHSNVDFVPIDADKTNNEKRAPLETLAQKLRSAIPPSEIEKDDEWNSLEGYIQYDEEDDDVCSLDDRSGYQIYDLSSDGASDAGSFHGEDSILSLRPLQMPWASYDHDAVVDTKKSVTLLASQQQHQLLNNQGIFEKDAKLDHTANVVRQWIEEKFRPNRLRSLSFVLFGTMCFFMICVLVSALLLLINMVTYANDTLVSDSAIARESIIGLFLLIVIPFVTLALGLVLYFSFRKSLLHMMQRRYLATSLLWHALHPEQHESVADESIVKNIYLQYLSKSTLKSDNHRQRAAHFLSLATAAMGSALFNRHPLYDKLEKRPGGEISPLGFAVSMRDTLFVSWKLLWFFSPLMIYALLSFTLYLSLYITHLYFFAGADGASSTERVMILLNVTALWTLASPPILIYEYFQRLDPLLQKIASEDQHSKRIVLSMPLKTIAQNQSMRNVLFGVATRSASTDATATRPAQRVGKEPWEIINARSLSILTSEQQVHETESHRQADTPAFDPSIPEHLRRDIMAADSPSVWSETVHTASVLVVEIRYTADQDWESGDMDVALLVEMQHIINGLLPQYKLLLVSKQSNRFICMSNLGVSGSESILQTKAVLEFCLSLAQYCRNLGNHVGTPLTLLIGVDTGPCILMVEQNQTQHHGQDRNPFPPSYHQMNLLGEAVKGAEHMVQMLHHNSSPVLQKPSISDELGSCILHVSRNCYVRVYDRFAFGTISHNDSDMPKSTSYVLLPGGGTGAARKDRKDMEASTPTSHQPKFHHITTPPALLQSQRTVDLRKFASSPKVISPASRRVMRKESTLLLTKLRSSPSQREPGYHQNSPHLRSLSSGRTLSTNRSYKGAKRVMSVFDVEKGSSVLVNGFETDDGSADESETREVVRKFNNQGHNPDVVTDDSDNDDDVDDDVDIEVHNHIHQHYTAPGSRQRLIF